MSSISFLSFLPTARPDAPRSSEGESGSGIRACSVKPGTAVRPLAAIGYAIGGALEVSRERKERGWPCARALRGRFAINTGSAAKKIGIGASSAQLCGPAAFEERSDSKATHRKTISVRSAIPFLTAPLFYHRSSL
jgi:hypothetical protein